MAGLNQKRRLFLSTTRFQDAGGPNGSGGEPTRRLPRVSPLIMKIITIIKIIETNGRLVSIILNHTLRPPLCGIQLQSCIHLTQEIARGRRGVNTEIDTQSNSRQRMWKLTCETLHESVSKLSRMAFCRVTPVKHKHMLFPPACSSPLITEDLQGSWPGRYMRNCLYLTTVCPVP